MTRVLVSAVLLGVFVTVVVFGLPVLLSHPTHHAHCPLQGAQTVMCESTTLEHIGTWQGMFSALLVLVISVLGTLILFFRFDTRGIERERLRLRIKQVVTTRPTLFQELYSNGILNRKESLMFS
jgi:hypothetical protein